MPLPYTRCANPFYQAVAKTFLYGILVIHTRHVQFCLYDDFVFISYASPESLV